MKRYLFSIIALAALCAPVRAQNAGTGPVRASAPGKNWEVSAGLGASCYFSENQRQITGSDVISFPMVNFTLTKWASPVFGFGVEIDYAKMKHGYCFDGTATPALFADPANDVKKTTGGSGNGYIASGFYFNPFIKAGINFANLFGGYRERVFDILAYLGGGLAVPMGDTGAYNDFRRVCPTFNLGLTGRFNLTEKLALDLNMRSAFVADNFNGLCYENTGIAACPFDIIVNVSVGITYKLGFTILKNHSKGTYTQKMYWVPEATAISCSKNLKDAASAKK